MQIKLIVSYDGTQYAGWQRQDNALAVQQVIEDALMVLLQKKITLTAASRTDAGVHALGQCSCFMSEDFKIPMEKLPMVLNGLLPGDVAIKAASVVPDDFNPRFHPKHKTYHYRFYHADTPNPLLNRYAVYVSWPMDVVAMQIAAAHFVGEHDFASFCAVGSSAKTTIRTIYACTVHQADDGMITLSITGNGFLYNMVRIIAGTLMYVGTGRMDANDIPGIIKSCNRNHAGKTMPPQGLCLMKIEY